MRIAVKNEDVKSDDRSSDLISDYKPAPLHLKGNNGLLKVAVTSIWLANE